VFDVFKAEKEDGDENDLFCIVIAIILCCGQKRKSNKLIGEPIGTNIESNKAAVKIEDIKILRSVKSSILHIVFFY